MPSSNLGFVSSQKLSHSRTRTSSGPVSQPSPPMTIPKSKNSRSMLIGVCSLLLATGIGFTSAWFIQDGRFSDTGNAPFPFNLTLESSSFSVTIPLETYVTIDYHSDGSEVDYYPIFRQVYSNSVLVPSYFRQCMGAMNLYTIFIGSPLRHRAKFDTRALYDSNTWTLLSMLGEIFNKQILLGFNLLQVRNSPGCQTTPYSPSYVQNMSKLDLPLIYCGSKYVTFPSMIAQSPFTRCNRLGRLSGATFYVHGSTREHEHVLCRYCSYRLKLNHSYSIIFGNQSVLVGNSGRRSWEARTCHRVLRLQAGASPRWFMTVFCIVVIKLGWVIGVVGTASMDVVSHVISR